MIHGVTRRWTYLIAALCACFGARASAQVNIYMTHYFSSDGRTLYATTATTGTFQMQGSCSGYTHDYWASAGLTGPNGATGAGGGNYSSGWAPACGTGTSTSTAYISTVVDGAYYASQSSSADCSYAGQLYSDNPPPQQEIDTPVINMGGVVDNTTGNPHVYVGASGYLAIYGLWLTADGQDPNPAVSADDPNIQLGAPSYATDDQINVPYTIKPGAATGGHAIYVTTTLGQCNPGSLGVYDQTPVITSIAPGSFQAGDSYSVTISGSHFGTVCPTVAISGAGNSSFGVTGGCSDTSVAGTATFDVNATGPTATVTLTSKGYGNGFLPAPGQPSGGQRGVTIAPAKATPHMYFNGQEVTNRTTTVIVGQQIQLMSTPTLPGGITVQSHSWSVPGAVVANYQASDAQAQVTEYTPPDASDTSFYWFAAGANTVTDTFVLSNGVSQTATAAFQVVAPSWEQLTLNHGVVNINSSCYGSLFVADGTCLPVGDGIDVSAGVTVPSGFSGTWSWSQFVTAATASLTSKATGKTTTCSASGGDASTLNEGATVWFDDPGISLDTGGTYNEEADADSFMTYLMFMPTGAGSIWVPLASLTWSWSGVAVNTGGSQNAGWAVQSSTNPPPSALASTPPSLGAFPQWSANVQPILKACLNSGVQQ